MDRRCNIHIAGRLLAALFLTVSFAMTALAGDEFLSTIDDLPLMSGLNEVEDAQMVFDSPSGRIVEALTAGKVAREQVLRFYSETMPQLGWTEQAPGNFSREGEILRLEFPPPSAAPGAASSVATSVINVRFMLSPAK